jgi:HK97 family phage portal protein
VTAVIQSLGGLADLQPAWGSNWPQSWRTSVTLDGRLRDYASIYRTQPNVRICVDFLARNVAQLGLHAFRRIDENDRVRLRPEDSELAALIKTPNPSGKTTRYRLLSGTMMDLGIYYRAYWLKLRSTDTGQLAVLRIPPIYMQTKGTLVPTGYEMNLGGKRYVFAPQDVVHFWGDNPENAADGLSPMETLGRLLDEDEAAGAHRERYWQNAARMGGIIERPATAPDWGVETRNRFKAEFEALYSGSEAAGRTAILEDGMVWKPGTFSSEQSEGVEHRKLTREEVARSYHIPLPMIGILDHATFSNIREQHKNLYQDCLGPWLVSIEEDLELQLFPDIRDDMQGVYVEFNIAEKLSGSFEEQAAVLQSAVGRPFMTPNEARARFNLPGKGGDADELAIPVNLVIDDPVTGMPTQTDQAQAAIAAVQQRTLNRQRTVIEKRLGAGFETVEDAWDDARWDRELAADLGVLGIGEPLEAAQQMNAEHRALIAAEVEATHAA